MKLSSYIIGIGRSVIYRCREVVSSLKVACLFRCNIDILFTTPVKNKDVWIVLHGEIHSKIEIWDIPFYFIPLTIALWAYVFSNLSLLPSGSLGLSSINLLYKDCGRVLSLITGSLIPRLLTLLLPKFSQNG